MTDTDGTPGATPAGWYADPWGAAPQRWWDGRQWTAHTSQPAAGQSAAASPAAQPPAVQPSVVQSPVAQPPVPQSPVVQQPVAQPAGAQYAYQQPVAQSYVPALPGPRPQIDPATPVGTVWIWLVVLLPVLTIALLPFIHITIPPIDASGSTAYIGNPIDLIGGPLYFVLIAVSWLTYAANVVFSWLDHRELARRGVVRPFHWAWSFLSQLVYVIGRTVIVGQVAQRRGKAPLWATIGVIALSLIVSIVWSIMLVSSIGEQISHLTTYGA